MLEAQTPERDGREHVGPTHVTRLRVCVPAGRPAAVRSGACSITLRSTRWYCLSRYIVIRRFRSVSATRQGYAGGAEMGAEQSLSLRSFLLIAC